MKNNNEWGKRRRRYIINNNIVCKLFVRLYYEFEELIWLMVSVGLLVVILKLFSFLF